MRRRAGAAHGFASMTPVSESRTLDGGTLWKVTGVFNRTPLATGNWASGLSIGSVHKLSGPRYNAGREQCHLKRRRTGSRSTNTSRLNAPPNAGLSIAKAKWSVGREELVSMRRSHAIFSGTWLTGYPKPVKLTEAT